MVFTYKALHGLVNCSAVSFGLKLKISRTRGDGITMNQRRSTTHASSQLSAVRAPSAWNKLSPEINGCTSFQRTYECGTVTVFIYCSAVCYFYIGLIDYLFYFIVGIFKYVRSFYHSLHNIFRLCLIPSGPWLMSPHDRLFNPFSLLKI